jgi:hypothetical protein
MTDDWSKQASRLRELARDPAVRAYLLGRLLAESSAAELHDLVQACLAYRERFGASGNRFGGSTAEALRRLRAQDDQAWAAGHADGPVQPSLPDL